MRVWLFLQLFEQGVGWKISATVERGVGWKYARNDAYIGSLGIEEPQHENNETVHKSRAHTCLREADGWDE